jgi:protein-disulfide isomerase
MTTSKRSSKRDDIRARREAASKRQRLLMIIIVAVAVIAVAAIILVPMLKPPFQGMARTNTKDNSVGDPNAPVKVMEFADFQCPYCEQWHTKNEPDFYKNYVETGKVYFTYIPFSFLGQESVRASEAAYCANDQGKFWDYHDILYANQGAENSGAFSDQNLITFAQDLKLNMSDFNNCFTTGKYAQKVQDDVTLAKNKGVNATPYFIVNDGQPIDMNTLQSAVDAALAQNK